MFQEDAAGPRPPQVDQAEERLATHEVPTPVQPAICNRPGCTIVLNGGFPHSGLCSAEISGSRTRRPSSQSDAAQSAQSAREPDLYGVRSKRMNELAEAEGWGSYQTLAQRERDSPIMLSAAIRRWRGNSSRLCVIMRPYFTTEAWTQAEMVAINRYFVDYVKKFPIMHGAQRECSLPGCQNGTLVQQVAPTDPFIMRHDESDPEHIAAFELDHIVEVQDTCQKWAAIRHLRDLSSPWDSGLSSDDANQILEDLFSPDGVRWRCGTRMPSLGGLDCHNGRGGLSADRRRQNQAMSCERCKRAFESQQALASHMKHCQKHCMTCGARFGNSYGCRIHSVGCSARRAEAQRAAQGDDESQVM